MYTRKQFAQIQKYLTTKDILLIVGPRQVGKTTLLKQIRDTLSDEKKWSWLTLEDPDIRSRLDMHPEELFAITNTLSSQEQIIFIDEIQYLRDPTNFLKYLYDMYAPNLKLIVTGSSSFYIDQKFRDSLIGRKKVFTLLPLDFREFLHFRGYKEGMDTRSEHQKLAGLFGEYVTYGGYPEIVLLSDVREKEERLTEYARDYVKKDIYESGIQDEVKYFSLIRILADQTGSLMNTSELARTLGLSQPTIEKFLFVLQKTFHVALIRPWHTNIRKELTKMPKAYFYDLGIRNAFMRNFSAIDTRLDKGGYTENIFFRFLLEQHFLDDVGFWRTQDKQEVDFIVEGKNAIEIKYQKKGISTTTYGSFTEKYPDMPFEILEYEDILNRWMKL